MEVTHPMENTRHQSRQQLPRDLAAALRAARVASGLGLRAMAREIPLSAGYLSLLETGQRCPSAAVAHDLVAALKLPLDLESRLLAAAQPDAGRSREAAAELGDGALGATSGNA